MTGRFFQRAVKALVIVTLSDSFRIRPTKYDTLVRLSIFTQNVYSLKNSVDTGQVYFL